MLQLYVHPYALLSPSHSIDLPSDTIPEIQRCHLSSVVLQLLALGITNILEFDFMDPPSEESLVKALEQLYLLGAVDKSSNEELRLTPLGKRMAHFPLEPTLSKAIIVSNEQGCTEEVVTIVSMLSVDSVLFTPRDKQDEALSARKKFVSSDGDHITLLQIYRAYKSAKGNKVHCMHPSLVRRYFRFFFSLKQAWCRENFIHTRNMHKVLDVRKQLLELCARVKVEVNSFSGRECSDPVRKSLLGGLFTNVAEHTGEGKYRTVRKFKKWWKYSTLYRSSLSHSFQLIKKSTSILVPVSFIAAPSHSVWCTLNWYTRPNAI